MKTYTVNNPDIPYNELAFLNKLNIDIIGNGNENKNNSNCYVPNVGFNLKYPTNPTLSYTLAEDTGVRRGNACG